VKLFRVVLRLVPGLFYVKSLEERMFHVFHVFRAHAYTGAHSPTLLLYARINHGTRRTRGTKNVFNRLECSLSSPNVEQTWNRMNFKDSRLYPR
jgi:hypothetical protein